MKKIMFNDRYGLTQAVLDGRKTMTRRMAKAWEREGGMLSGWYRGSYKIGDTVAIAQKYSELSWDKNFYDKLLGMCKHLPQYELAGWDNKMFVRADLMPHYIRFTNLRVERMQDISDEDCFKEGVQAVCIPEGWRYIAGGEKIHDVDRGRIWSGELKLSEKSSFDTPRSAFSALIDKVSGRGTWNSNPYVFVYEFELVK